MKKLKGLLFIVGAILVFGGIGSEQTGVISFAQAMKQCLIGLPMFAIGVM
jgi:hypothetical protein